MNETKFEHWSELSADGNEYWYFRLKAPNGKIICQSEAYKTRQGCLNGIQSVRHNAPLARTVLVP